MDIDSSKRTELKKCVIEHLGHYENFSIDDYIHAHGKASDVFLYFALFFPEFTEIESIIFLKRNVVSIEEVKDQILAKKKSTTKIQMTYNFVETGYLFNTEGRDTSDEEDELLSSLLQYAWECHLNRVYPNRKFKVEILSPEETGSSFGVHFYEN